MALLEEMQCKLAAWQKISYLEKRKLLQLAAEAVFLTGSVLVGVQPTFTLIPLIQSSDSRGVSTGGPDGRKFQSFCDGIELLPPGIQKSEALTILDYRRKRDLK